VNATTPTHRGSRPFAVVTGASSGIGYELARCCARDGYDLLLAADEPQLEDKARQLREFGTDVQSVQVDLATDDGIERLVAAAGDRRIDALIANAGHGLGKGFLDQDLAAARHVLDTNATGTIALVHRLGRRMRDRGYGRILITGSIAGFMPGSYQAVYNASKAFLDSFAYALREELRGSGVTVTCLMPGATDTAFFARAGMLDTRIAASGKDDPAEVARQGYEAMCQGAPGVVTGTKNKMQVAMSNVMPQTALARMHTRQAAPGSARSARAARIAGGSFGGLLLLAAAAWWLASSHGHGSLPRRAFLR
jgi:short-subunit dehydrogenase